LTTWEAGAHLSSALRNPVWIDRMHDKIMNKAFTFKKRAAVLWQMIMASGWGFEGGGFKPR